MMFNVEKSINVQKIASKSKTQRSLFMALMNEVCYILATHFWHSQELFHELEIHGITHQYSHYLQQTGFFPINVQDISNVYTTQDTMHSPPSIALGAKTTRIS